MTTAFIIEDEIPAAELLRKLLHQRNIAVLDVSVSAVSASTWFRNNEHPDLVFMDIALRDADCFRIFEQVDIKSPIIFTTAYDDFALKAFDYNSVAYLLKPIRESELDKALLKLQSRIFTKYDHAKWTANQTVYKTSFLVSAGSTLRKINSHDVACFMSDCNVTYLQHQARQYAIGQSLEKLEPTLDPSQFFRISRKFTINRHFVDKFSAVGPLAVLLSGYPRWISVSRSRSKAFLEWYQK